MSIRLYGETRITTDSGDVSPGRAKERALLALLAVRPNRVIPVDVILEALWPQDPAVGRRSLLVRVSNVRKQLGEAAAIESVEGGYRLVVDDSSVDIVRFAELVTAAAASQGTARKRLLDEAIDLRDAEPLVEHAYTEFARHAIDRDLETAAHAARMLAELEVEEGRIDAALARLHEATQLSPVDESLVAARMELLADGGRVADALREYATLADRLDERGLSPSPWLVALEERILVGETAAADLPAEPEMWGRTGELAELQDLLATRSLVNIIGPPGVGKTTIALVLANRWDGPAAWVPLDETAETDVGRAARSAIDAVTGPGRLRGLVVLDNCEHVTEAVAQVLNSSPSATLLLTSRVAVETEQLYTLRPLPVSTEIAEGSVNADSAAVRIFERRAAAADAKFDVTAHLDDVASVCDSLDGLPLAIELAASRVTIMSPAQIAERLSKAGRSADTSGLPKSLESTIRWSIENLSPGARDLLLTLSTCAGSFDLELAEAMASGSETSLHDDLTELVTHSLVQRRDRGGFSMLSTVSAVAADLAPSNEAVVGKHTARMAELAANAADVADRARFMAACEVLDDNAANLRLAVERSLETDPVLAARMLTDSWRWWHGSGRWNEGARLYRDVLARAVPADRTARFEFLNAACRLLLFGGGPEDLLFAVLDDADRLAEVLGRRKVRDVRGLALRMADRLDESIAVHELEAEELRADGVSARAALANVAAVRVLLGDISGARVAALAAMESATEHGEAGFDTTPVTLAEVEFLDGNYERSIEVAEAWLATAGGTESGFRCEALQAVALSHLELGDTRSATEVLPELIALGVRLRGTHLAMVMITAAVAALAAGRDADARDLVATAAASDQTTPRPHIASYMSQIGTGTAVPVTDALRTAYDIGDALASQPW